MVEGGVGTYHMGTCRRGARGGALGQVQSRLPTPAWFNGG